MVVVVVEDVVVVVVVVVVVEEEEEGGMEEKGGVRTIVVVDGCVVWVLCVDADGDLLVVTGLSCDVSSAAVVVVMVVVLFVGTPPASSLHFPSTFTLPSGHVHSTPAGWVWVPP